MDFYSMLDDVLELLRQRGRVTYRALKRQFHLDDDVLDDLKEELIKAQRVAVDENGDVLVWVGDVGTPNAYPAIFPAGADACGRGRSSGPRRIPSSRTAYRLRPNAASSRCCSATLVDSTVLASQLDPEEWREVVRAYQDDLCQGDRTL